jgi:mxaJ protein
MAIPHKLFRRSVWLSCAALGVVATAAFTAAPSHTLRVCADPDDLPFSDSALRGFENKIASVIARDLGDTVAYTWWPNRRGFIAHTLRVGRCDVVIEAPKGLDIVLTTKPYFRSTYYFVTRHDRPAKPTSLDDPLLRKMHIGVSMMGEDYALSPPGQALTQRGLGAHLFGFQSYYDADHHPGDIIDAVSTGKVEAAVAWGPLAGYYAKHSSVPLDLSPLPDSDTVTGYPMAYDVALGVRITDRALRDTLNKVIDRKQAAIDSVLHDFGIPTLPLPAASAPPTSR